jgi:hypothetical protein
MEKALLFIMIIQLGRRITVGGIRIVCVEEERK